MTVTGTALGDVPLTPMATATTQYDAPPTDRVTSGEGNDAVRPSPGLTYPRKMMLSLLGGTALHAFAVAPGTFASAKSLPTVPAGLDENETLVTASVAVVGPKTSVVDGVLVKSKTDAVSASGDCGVAGELAVDTRPYASTFASREGSLPSAMLTSWPV